MFILRFSIIHQRNAIFYCQYLQMANRNFSEEPLPITKDSGELGVNRKLRQVGSTTTLLSGKTYNNFESETQTIGHYTYNLKHEIGNGYTSKVYKCKNTKDNSDLAVKVIDLKKYTPSSIEMLDNQIQILKKLDHPNVLKFQNFYRTNTNCYLITEYCPNGDLLDYMTKNGKSCEKEAISIINQIIQGVKYLFAMGVLHRDIKPANILKGTKNNWKIADFGFAINASGQTKTRHNVGTPLYMPLESLTQNIYSPESDIFSIGVILYELIIGITPWQSRSQKELIKKLKTVSFSVPEKYNISQHIKHLLAKFCAVQKVQRMSKEQFMNLNINNFIGLNDFNQPRKNSLSDAKNQRKNSILSLPKSKIIRAEKLKQFDGQYKTYRRKISTQSGKKSQNKESENIKIVDIKAYGSKRRSSKDSRNSSQKRFESKLDKKNYEIIVNQLNYCRFMYYLIENSLFMPLSLQSKNKLCLVLFKHLLKIIKHLADNKINWYGFSNWNQFRKSQTYEITHKTLRQYCQKYQKQYLTFLKKADISTIKEINQKMPEFGTSEQFSITFFRKIQNFIALMLRQSNHNLVDGLHSFKNVGFKNDEMTAKFECMKSIYRYYKLVEMSIKQFQNFSYFEEESKIQIIKNYKQSKIRYEDYIQIRQEIKNL